MRVNFRTYLLGTAMAAVGGGPALADGGLDPVIPGSYLTFEETEDDAAKNGRCDPILGMHFSEFRQAVSGNQAITTLRDEELVFEFRGTADNGLQYGFKVNLDDAPDTGFTVDEAFLFISGDFGTIRLGDDDAAGTPGREFAPGIGEHGDDNPSLSRARLNFDTSLTGENWLMVRFAEPSGSGDISLDDLRYHFPLGNRIDVAAGTTEPRFRVATGGQWDVEVNDGLRYDTPSVSGFSLPLAARWWDLPPLSEQPVDYGAGLSYSGDFGQAGLGFNVEYGDGGYSDQPEEVRRAIDVMPEGLVLKQYQRNGASDGNISVPPSAPVVYRLPQGEGQFLVGPLVNFGVEPHDSTNDAVIGQIRTTFEF